MTEFPKMIFIDLDLKQTLGTDLAIEAMCCHAPPRIIISKHHHIIAALVGKK